jgi:hypothetical protein
MRACLVRVAKWVVRWVAVLAWFPAPVRAHQVLPAQEQLGASTGALSTTRTAHAVGTRQALLG